MANSVRPPSLFQRVTRAGLDLPPDGPSRAERELDLARRVLALVNENRGEIEASGERLHGLVPAMLSLLLVSYARHHTEPDFVRLKESFALALLKLKPEPDAAYLVAACVPGTAAAKAALAILEGTSPKATIED